MSQRLSLNLLVCVLAATMMLTTNSLAQYSCKQAPCIVVSSNGWIVGEVRAFAFGEDAKNPIMKELASKGWLECGGQALPRAGYQQLFKAIGDTWGSQDGRTDFSLPDLRAQFLRGWNHGASEPQAPAFIGDPDATSRSAPRTFSPGGTNGNSADAVGSIEAELVGQHEHRTDGFGYATLHNTEFGNGIGGLYNINHFDTTSVIGNPQENRPHNVYVMYAIYTGVPSVLTPNVPPSPIGAAKKTLKERKP
jgi:phage-related tail fiber protein